MAEPTTLRCKIAERIALVTLDRPPVNAMNLAMHADLRACFDRLSDDPAVGAVILTGAGRVFCAGADMKERAAFPDEPGFRWRQARSVRECLNAVTECHKPVIAALNGPALGGGLALAAACDLLLAAEGATVGLPEVTVGLLGGARHAMRLFGHSTLRRMVLSGHRLDARELWRRGVVEAVVPPGDLLAEARGIAGEMAALDPVAVAQAKLTLNAIESMPLREGYRFEQEQTARLLERSRGAPKPREGDE